MSDNILGPSRCGNCNGELGEDNSRLRYLLGGGVMWEHREPGDCIKELARRIQVLEDREEKKALAEMANESQKLGLYEDFDTGKEEAE
jgi:hypothetical protein